jgi:hypothetical protein
MPSMNDDEMKYVLLNQLGNELAGGTEKYQIFLTNWPLGGKNE